MPLPAESRRPKAYVSKFGTATAAAGTTTKSLAPRSSSCKFAALVLAGALACSSDDLILPGDGEPARIVPVGDLDLSGTVGQPLAQPLVVEITDSEDRPVAGVEVVFVPPEGGSLTQSTVLTDDAGLAAVEYTLSTTSGEQIVEARAASIVPESASSTSFVILALPQTPEALAPAGGDGQSAQVATVLPESLAVRAVDRFGNGVPGIEVEWEAAGGGGVSPAAGTTGADGRAATQRSLGDRPGSYSTTARADGLGGSSVTFTATAVAPPSPQLTLVTSPPSNASAGVTLDPQPELQLQDAVGAPLRQADVAVTVQIETGGGSLGGRKTVRSDAEGRVRFTDLEIRGRPGVRRLIFAAEGFTPAISASITVGPGPPDPERSSVSVPNGTAGEATSIAIRVQDEFGTAIEGWADRIDVSVGGANQVSDLTVTEQEDGSYSASYTPTHAGSDQIDIRVGGTPLAGSPFASAVSPGPADPGTSIAVVTRTGGIVALITVQVTTLDAHGNPLGRGGDLVQVQPNDGDFRTATDNGDGTYYDQFFAIAVSLEVTVLLNGVPVSGSPFRP